MAVFPVITIDGPSGVGKSVLTKELAKILGWNILNSGIIYRLLALIAIEKKIDINEELMINKLINGLNTDLILKFNELFFLSNNNIQDYINNEYVGRCASIIAMFPKVREISLHIQRSFKTFPGLIADGRDMGTKVFPDAIIKIFLYASLKERSKRRVQQLREKGFNVNLDYIKSEIYERDNRDYNRILSPLIPATGAWKIDTTYLSIKELTIKIFTHIEQNSLLLNLI